MLETDDLSGYACIGVLRIAESREDKNVLLDDQFMPSCLDCRAASRLAGFLPELAGLLHHRGETIACRLADALRGGTAEIADYMMLQMKIGRESSREDREIDVDAILYDNND